MIACITLLKTGMLSMHTVAFYLNLKQCSSENSLSNTNLSLCEWQGSATHVPDEIINVYTTLMRLLFMCRELQ
jgi:hypothetical protein